MLNKLLKRCAPWMDKGRWYKITFGGDSPDTLEFKFDPIFENVNYVGFSDGNITIGADFAVNENNLHVIDVKFVGEPGFYNVGTSVTAARSATNDLEIVCQGPGTIWLFIASTRRDD